MNTIQVNDKYRLTEPGTTPKGDKLFQIQALKDISSRNVKKGDYGGFVQSEQNLSFEGDAWISETALVMGTSEVKGNAYVSGNANILDSNLSGDVRVSGNVKIVNSSLFGTNVSVLDEAVIEESDFKGTNILIKGKAVVEDCEMRGNDITIEGNAFILGLFCKHEVNEFLVSGNARIENIEDDETNIGGSRIKIKDNALLQSVLNISGDDIVVKDDAKIESKTVLQGNNITIQDAGCVSQNVFLYDNIEVSECARLYNPELNFMSLSNLRFYGDVNININEV